MWRVAVEANARLGRFPTSSCQRVHHVPPIYYCTIATRRVPVHVGGQCNAVSLSALNITHPCTIAHK